MEVVGDAFGASWKLRGVFANFRVPCETDRAEMVGNGLKGYVATEMWQIEGDRERMKDRRGEKREGR